jgi:transposase
LLVGVELNPGPSRLTPYQRWKIVILAEQKKNNSTIAREVGCDPHTVTEVLNRYETTGTVEEKPGRGRKRKFSNKEEKTIIQKAKKGKSSPQIARELRKKRMSKLLGMF